jgi:uncharacterized membrane protein
MMMRRYVRTGEPSVQISNTGLMNMDEIQQSNPLESSESMGAATPIVRERVITASFCGPIPPPNALKAYNDILPGAADRILSMAEQQAGHRQRMEKEIIESSLDHERTGMIFAFVLTLGLMIIGSVLIAFGKNVAGFFAIFIPVVFQAANYLYIKKTEKEEKKQPSTEEGN